MNALVIAQNHAFLVPGDEVVRHDRGLAAAAGCVHTKVGTARPGMAAEVLDDLHALGHGGAENG
jgi:hypothetical protein